MLNEECKIIEDEIANIFSKHKFVLKSNFNDNGTQINKYVKTNKSVIQTLEWNYDKI